MVSGKTFAEPLPAPRSPLPAYAPVGVFGGTFDPIHFGHLRLAEDMAGALGLDRVLFIPAGQPPHRDAPRTASHHRLEMVRRAISGNPRFVVDEREVQRPQPSYTVDTLAALRAELGEAKPLWLRNRCGCCLGRMRFSACQVGTTGGDCSNWQILPWQPGPARNWGFPPP